MNVMQSDFTLWRAMAGGVLIGIASLIALLATGKIPGISGLFSALIRPGTEGRIGWTVFFVGLVAGAAVAFAVSEASAAYRPERPLGVFVLAGLLVGLGTRLGGGCTSGHGVCGIGLCRKSSLVATMVFIAAGMLTVYILRQWSIGLSL